MLMRRREFITLVGGVIARPLAVRAEQASKIPTVGVLWHAGSAQGEGLYPSALRQALKGFGYIEGQNIRLAISVIMTCKRVNSAIEYHDNLVVVP